MSASRNGLLTKSSHPASAASARFCSNALAVIATTTVSCPRGLDLMRLAVS